MITINIILFTVVSMLLLYNVTAIVSFITSSQNKLKLTFPVIIYIFSSIIYNASRNGGYTTVLQFICFIIYNIILVINIYFFDKYSFNKSIFIFLLYSEIDSIICSAFRYIIYPFFNDKPPQYINIILSIVSSLLLFAIIKYLVKKKSDSVIFAANHIPKHIYILILLALFFSGGLLEIQVFNTNNIALQNNIKKSFTVICIFLLILIIFLLVFNCISSLYFENQSSLLEKQVETQVNYYKKIDKLNDDVRQFRHDYRNHLLCIQGMLKAQEYDEAIAYAEKLTEHTAASSPKYFTGNSIADSILNDKLEYAQNIGAEIKCDGIIHEDIPAIDICIILANALDNALEACEKITDSSPKIISVKCDYFKCIQLICITNPISENVVIHNNNIETSKSDKNNHGIGLYNIRKTVAKYNGEFDITCDNNVFTLDIALKVH